MGLFKRLFGDGHKVPEMTSHTSIPPAPSPAPRESPSIQVPFETVTVHGRNATAQLQKLAQQWEPEGCFPVLIGDADDAAGLFEFYENKPPSIIAAAEQVNVEQWIAKKHNLDPEMMDMLEVGSWPARPDTQNQLATPFRLTTGTPRPNLMIASVPADQPWHIPAHLCFGGWNECPEPEVQVAFAKMWYERFGAVIVAVTGDVVEYAVQRPPTTNEVAEVLAYEQFAYCEDIILQGFQTVRNLAASLIDAPYWFFWWD